MSDDHDHGAHAAIEVADTPNEFEILETAIRELSIAKGYFSAEDHRRFIEWAESISPAAGARMVARAWVDPEYKKQVLADGTAAAQEIGIDMTAPTGQGTPSDYIYLVVHENTPKVHNVIVCTLCSCYPRWVLGMEPAWYKSFNYRRRMVRWPRQVLAEFGTIIPDDVEVRVHDSNQKTRYMVMPLRPSGTDGWTEEQLAAIVTRDTMIGVAVPTIDAAVIGQRA